MPRADGATGLSPADEAAVTAQIGRPPRAAVDVAARCPCGQPAVITTAPRLEDGTPFPTTYYLTCPRLNARLSTLESAGLMSALEQRVAEDPQFAAAYRAAHQSYLAERESLGVVEEIHGITAGGMPTRVKCLHALAAHALAAGPGVNPAGDAALVEIGEWWTRGSCARPGTFPGPGAESGDDVMAAPGAHGESNVADHGQTPA